MKQSTLAIVLASLLAMNSSLLADITFTGTAVNNITLATNPAGSLSILVAGSSFAPANIDTSTSLSIGSLFSGDLIFARNSIQDVFGSGVISGAATFLLASDPNLGLKIAAGTPFYLVWFPTIASSETDLSSHAGADFRRVSIGSWLTPASDGAFTFAASGGDFPTQSGASATSFTVIPEPTAAILLGLGLLGLVTRRRR